MKKKILAVALATMLLATCLLPCAAFADEAGLPSESEEKLFELRDGLKPFYEEKLVSEDKDWSKVEEFNNGMYTTNILYERYAEYEVWKTYKFEYLVQIPNTPFAELKSINIDFPVKIKRHFSKLVELDPLGNILFEDISKTDAIINFLTVDDLFYYYDFKTFGVLQSNLKEFEITGSVIRAKYYESFYLCAKNADGAFKNYYLDCNETLKDYCKPDLDAELLPNEIYEIFINDIYNKYKLELVGRKVEDLYGYWGFCAIPEGNVFNEFFQTIGTGAFLSPNIHYFQFIEKINWKENGELQKEYGYTTLGRIFNFIVKIHTSTKLPTLSAFLVYVEGGDSTILISKNGSTDLDNNMGAGGNSIVDGIQSIDWSKFSPSTVLALILALAFVVLIFVVVLKIGKKRKK